MDDTARWHAESVVTDRARFVVTFLLIAGSLSLLYAYSYPPDSLVGRGLERYLSGYAQAAGALLSLFDPAVHVSGSSIFGRFSLRIVKDCDAMEVKILFGAAVLAFPSDWRRRVLGVTGGIALLFVVNLARICSLYFVGVHAPGAFEPIHREVWPLLMITLAAVAFLAWVRWATHQPSEACASSGQTVASA
jgi:exosortase H (IPTLxxWG-CTERM-specific)